MSESSQKKQDKFLSHTVISRDHKKGLCEEQVNKLITLKNIFKQKYVLVIYNAFFSTKCDVPMLDSIFCCIGAQSVFH